MELPEAFQIIPSKDGKPGALAVFPYDRDLVRRFREAFPQARWREAGKCWFVPGITAARRLNAWMSQELETLDQYADVKGRDAFAFDSLESPYLEAGEDLEVRTPYSRRIVETMRTIPWARWDSERKIWRVPFRSYEELRRRWPEIEESARRNEPEARRRRRTEAKNQRSGIENLRQAERRQRRYPVPGDDLPPLERPVATSSWGVVVFEEIGGERIADVAMKVLYPHLTDDPARYVWARWRMPELWELYRARPVPEDEHSELRLTRGWWLPTRDELQDRARQLRQVERALQTRRLVRKRSAKN
jgi:hypothetical protein